MNNICLFVAANLDSSGTNPQKFKLSLCLRGDTFSRFYCWMTSVLWLSVLLKNFFQRFLAFKLVLKLILSYFIIIVARLFIQVSLSKNAKPQELYVVNTCTTCSPARINWTLLSGKFLVHLAKQRWQKCTCFYVF